MFHRGDFGSGLRYIHLLSSGYNWMRRSVTVEKVEKIQEPHLLSGSRYYYGTSFNIAKFK